MILDLITLEKAGKFKEFQHLVRVDNGKRGLQVVMLYLVVGRWRVPWSFPVYQGKDTPTLAQLGLRLVRRLPKILIQHFKVLVLADTAFGSNEFITKIHQLKHYASVGIRCDRKLADGRGVAHLVKKAVTPTLTKRSSFFIAIHKAIHP